MDLDRTAVWTINDWKIEKRDYAEIRKIEQIDEKNKDAYNGIPSNDYPRDLNILFCGTA